MIKKIKVKGNGARPGERGGLRLPFYIVKHGKITPESKLVEQERQT